VRLLAVAVIARVSLIESAALRDNLEASLSRSFKQKQWNKH
jgi:hypothetical protein